jgi:hypothetical protein
MRLSLCVTWLLRFVNPQPGFAHRLQQLCCSPDATLQAFEP